MSEATETYMREHFARQRVISTNAARATSKLAQANTELILGNGLASLQARKIVDIEQIETIRDKVIGGTDG